MVYLLILPALAFNNTGRRLLTNIGRYGAIGNGQLSDMERLDNNLLNLSLLMDSLDASNFPSLVGTSISGNITSHASITGNLDNPSVTGVLQALRSSMMGLTLIPINAGFYYSKIIHIRIQQIHYR